MDAPVQYGTTVSVGKNHGMIVGANFGEIEITNNVTNHNRYERPAPTTDAAYFTGLGVDPEDSRTKALRSAGDGPIRECWDWILVEPGFEAWREAEDTSVVWVAGGPGKGKTSMALGLVDELIHLAQRNERDKSDSKAFVGYFFCQKLSSTMKSVSAILRGLIYGVGQKERPLMQFLKDKFQSAADIKKAGVDTWGVLAKMLTEAVGFGTAYLVVDALDECSDEEDVKHLLGLVGKASFGRRVKWFFCSRQSPQFDRSFGSMETHTINLDTAGEVGTSVNKYLEVTVGRSQYLTEAQKSDILKFLRSKTEKTFLYVSLVWRELRDTPRTDLAKRLSELINNNHGEGVYSLYRLMIGRVVEHDAETKTSTLQDLLKAVLLASQPLSPAELAILAGMRDDLGAASDAHGEIVELAQQCGHLLTVTGEHIYLVHTSAKDFLTVGDGSSERPFLSSPSEGHAKIAERCLTAMGPDLLPTPDFSTLNSLGTPDPPHELLWGLENFGYAYCHWAHHAAGGHDSLTWSVVEKFLEERFFSWVEAMSYLDQIQHCIDMVQDIRTAALQERSHNFSALQTTKALLDDAFRFLIRYRPIIQAHPRQVHFLAKFFAPRTNLTQKAYEDIPCCLRITNNPPREWDPCLYTLSLTGYQWGEKDLRRVSDSRYGTVKGAAMFNWGNYRLSLTSKDFRLRFSSDGGIVSVGSSALGRNILRWNVADGSFYGSFNSPKDVIAHSNDGIYIAYWSGKGIAVWDVEASRLRCRLENSSVSCRSMRACFSFDNSAIAVEIEESPLFGMFRKKRYQLLIWDARHGGFLREIDEAAEERALTFKFVQGCHLLAILSDDTLVLHDMRTSEIQSYEMRSLRAGALSDDGKILAVATASTISFYNMNPFMEVSSWSVSEGMPELEAFLRQEVCSSPCNGGGIEFAISEDGATAALAFRDTIGFFDLEKNSGRPPTFHSTNMHPASLIDDKQSLQFNLPPIDTIKFSPCGHYLACARNDDAVSIWDVRAVFCEPSGESRLSTDPPLLDRLDWPGYESVAIAIFSPDGRSCGTRGKNQVDLWEVETASLKVHFKGHYFSLCANSCVSWAFSPDSRYALTAMIGYEAEPSSKTRRIRLVDTRDWTYTEREIPEAITAVAFNTQSTLFALAISTEPPQILFFDTASVECLQQYQARCTTIQAMTFSSSGTLIAGGSTGITSRKYFMWEESDYSRTSSFRPSRCLAAQRPFHNFFLAPEKPLDEFFLIKRIAVSPDDSTAVSIVYHLKSGLMGPHFSAWVDKVALGDSTTPATLEDQATIIDNTKMASISYLEVAVHDRYEYEVRGRSIYHFAGIASARHSPFISSRFGNTTAGITTDGLEIAPPTQLGRNTCNGVEIEHDKGLSWVTWGGLRILCFPHSIIRATKIKPAVQSVNLLFPPVDDNGKSSVADSDAARRAGRTARVPIVIGSTFQEGMSWQIQNASDASELLHF